MSASMFVGRVLLPGVGLALAGILAWHAWQKSGGDLRGPLALTALSTTQPPAQKAPLDSPLILAEGHVAAYPGADVTVGAELPGTISRLLVHEKSAVRTGDLLVEFRGDLIRASAEEAVARVAQADAELLEVEREKARANRLPESHPSAAETRERLEARWNAAKARRSEAVAGYHRVEAEFARTRVRSPIDGAVITRLANPGETVSAGTPLLRIADLNRLCIEAEIDAYDVARCAPGSAAVIAAQGFPDKSWRGIVEEVADSLVPRRIRPDDPGRPTDTRVLPVRIALHQQPAPLKLGMRVEVRIEEWNNAKSQSDIANSRPVESERR
jgi:RND family efflux transporter MFP subunit